jgi:ATP-dependent Clp protease ATP-binding subunit ClpB
MDAGNMLKPMLARGELRMVGATTLDEYREHIEKDPALERRFQQVFVGEPSVEDTIAILRGLKEKYEAHHKVADRRRGAGGAATLSDRYITGASCRTRPSTCRRGGVAAAHGDRLQPGGDRQAAAPVDRLQMEEMALAKGDRRSVEGASRSCAPDLADHARKSFEALRSHAGSGEGQPRPVGDLKIRIDELRIIADRAVRDGRLEQASRILYGEIPKLEANSRGRPARSAGMVSEEVTAEDIAEVVGRGPASRRVA